MGTVREAITTSPSKLLPEKQTDLVANVPMEAALMRATGCPVQVSCREEAALVRVS